MILNREEYYRKWRENNPEKIRKSNKKYRINNPEKVREANRKWSAANPEKEREHQRKYRAANPERIRETKRKWRENNPEKTREASRKWRANNPGASRKWRAANPEYMKKWRAANTERVRDKRIEYRAAHPERVSESNKKNLKTFREKNRNDPIYKMHQNMRSAMYGALKGRRKSASTMTIIGCTVEGLFEHLESCASWEPWMTRENYGRGGWDTDHIIAIAKWDKDCPLQFALCWDKSNLQPLEHIANIKKGGR